MSESISFKSQGTREEKYKEIFPQVQSVLKAESDDISNMANLAAILKEVFGFLWIGFYRVKGEELVLGPFQGPLACTRIAFGKGVCGTAWKEGRTLIVPDIEKFPGHIACSSLSKSEIVIPIFDQQKRVVAVLDVDSVNLNDFSAIDQYHLEKLTNLL